MRHSAAVAADDQMRAEARDRLRTAPLFFASIGDEDGHRVLGSMWAQEAATLGFLLVTIASVWEWVSEITGESDAQLVHRLMLTLAARRHGFVDDEGGDADEE
jgi:hypothetical protein